jgi:hypothetical protein
MTSAKEINILQQTPGMPVWQRNDYKHIIRNEKDLNNIRDYIINNPIKWATDDENPRSSELLSSESLLSVFFWMLSFFLT